MKIKRVLFLNKMKQEKKTENKLYIPPQTGDVRWKHLLMLSSSVIPKTYTPIIIFIIYTTLLKLLYDNFKEYPFIDHIFFPSSLVTYLGLVLSLLLVFRNNSAYDRYWEGRKAWGSIIHHARNLSRHIWIGVDIDENDKRKDEKLNLKKGEMRLIIALAVSICHALRGEYGWDYNDLAELVQHVPRFNSLITVAPKRVLKILPLEIAYHIEGYIYHQKTMPVPFINASMASLNAIVENFTSCERILTSPIPLIYGVHIKHAMIIYLLTLPLQIIKTCGWASVIIVLLTSFTFFGIEAISSEIENPFGGDANDLKLEEFCKQINEEINNMMKYFPSSIGLLDWLECEDIDDTSSSNTNGNSSTANLLDVNLNRDFSSSRFSRSSSATANFLDTNLNREFSSSRFSRSSSATDFINRRITGNDIIQGKQRNPKDEMTEVENNYQTISNNSNVNKEIVCK